MKSIVFLAFFAFASAVDAQISIVANPSGGCAPITVNFSVTGAPGGSTYEWYFGDGTISNLAAPVKTYTSGGEKFVGVDVFDAGGVFVGSDYQYLNLGGAPEQIYVNQETACIGDDISMYINNGITYQSYTINFGDGSPTQTNTWGSFYHSYTANGSYTVTITTVDACGTGQVTKQIDIVTNNPITPGLTINPTTVCPGDEITLYSNWYLNYVFDYGDGSQPSNDAGHSYASPGVYPVTVYLENGCGNTASLTEYVTVANNIPLDPLDLFVNATPDPQCPGDLVSFGASNGYSSYFWNFGNGVTSVMNYPEYGYSLPGSYNYDVTITNGCGLSETLSGTITIGGTVPVDFVDISAPGSVCPGEGFYVLGSSSGNQFFWNMGDGNTVIAENHVYAYSSPGVYNITLTVANGCGNTASSMHTIVVDANNPVNVNDYSVSIFPAQLCPGDTLLAFGGPGGGTGVNYLWDFGDGTTSAGQQPGGLSLGGLVFDAYKHSYVNQGTYTLTTTITNGCGNTGVVTQQVNVGPGAAPNAGFLFDNDKYNCLNEPVIFQGAGGMQYEWDFGDGSGILTTTGTFVPVYHEYANPGTYKVVLTVTNGCGLKDSDAAFVTIGDSRKTITTNTVNSNCGQANGKAVVIVSGANSPYLYQWTNGDNTAIADTLMAGIYQVNIVDSKGCTDFGIATVSDVEAPTIIPSNVVNVSCYGGQNGAIDITLIGSSAPYSYTWSNGKTTEDINNLMAGPYEVIVKDGAGCTATKSIYVNQPSETTVSIAKIDAACGQNNGQATVNVSGTNAPFNYVWWNGQSSQSVFGLGAGTYSVTVIDGNGCLYPTSVDISNFGGPVIRVDSVIIAGCGGGANSVYITPFGGVAPYTYNWSNGTTAQDLVSVAPGVYTITASGADNCKTVRSFNLDFRKPESQSICMVTVDPVSQKNIVVWEKPANQGNVSQYRIYKETSQAGLYLPVGTLPYDSVSQFLDITADPAIRSWRYRVTAVDNCGNESAPSQIHKTIHLTNNMGINGEVNLIWDFYNGMGYSTVNLWRFSTANGWEMIQAMPSNLTSYTDALPPSGGALAYTIEAIPDAPCVATRAVNHNTTRSNRTTSAMGPVTSTEEVNDSRWLSLYPNPANGIVHVDFFLNEYVDNAMLMVYDMHGRMVETRSFQDIFGQWNTTVDVSAWSAGMYQFVMQSGHLVISKRLVVNK